MAPPHINQFFIKLFDFYVDTKKSRHGTSLELPGNAPIPWPQQSPGSSTPRSRTSLAPQFFFWKAKKAKKISKMAHTKKTRKIRKIFAIAALRMTNWTCHPFRGNSHLCWRALLLFHLFSNLYFSLPHGLDLLRGGSIRSGWFYYWLRCRWRGVGPFPV